jgi:hypothetical protein
MITLTLEPEEFEYLCDALYNDRDVLMADQRIDRDCDDGMQMGDEHYDHLLSLNERMLELLTKVEDQHGFSEDLDKAIQQAGWRCDWEVHKRHADPNFQQADAKAAP